jgi:hypothetical protein
MVLHLLPVSYANDEIIPLEQEEIRLNRTDPQQTPPLKTDWVADPKEQIITHVETGCQFRAYPVPYPLRDGLVMPFAPTHDVAVRFASMIDDRPRPANIRDLGKQGIEWILRYTFESHRR